ncbi:MULTISPECIES: hypothetical protein [unclassified Clostridium]|nr:MULTISPECIES: hypothetical protein [unclassified Clostridium]EKQ56254.1 MAG: hypothetical protein A370_02010 [Clostridium sp. Maddingley MBC34-26]
MLGIFITIILTIAISQLLIVVWNDISGKLYFKRQIENKLGRKIKFKDIK